MPSVRPITNANLGVNPDWPSLPLFNRKGWKRLPFGAFADSVNERVDPANAGEDIYVGLDGLDSGSLHIRRWGKGSDVIGTKLCFRKGDIIFGRRRAYQRKLVVAEMEGICSAHAMVVRAKPEVVLPEFLPFLMMSDKFMSRAVEISVGSLSPTINWTTLRLQEFDLPPLDQQRRIAEIFWAVDEVLQHYRKVKLEAITYRDSFAINCFKGKSPRQNSTLGDACSMIRDGTHLPPPRTKEGPLLLGVTNIVQGRLILTEGDTRVSESFYDKMHQSWRIEPCDVLLAIVGATIGKTAQVPKEFPRFTVQRSVAVLRGRDGILRNDFLRYFLASKIGQRRIWAKVNQTAQPGVYLGELSRIAIPLLTLKEQEAMCSEFAAAKDVEIEAEEHGVRTASLLANLTNTILLDT
jgi:restriction endonuclease S subunit